MENLSHSYINKWFIDDLHSELFVFCLFYLLICYCFFFSLLLLLDACAYILSYSHSFSLIHSVSFVRLLFLFCQCIIISVIVSHAKLNNGCLKRRGLLFATVFYIHLSDDVNQFPFNAVKGYCCNLYREREIERERFILFCSSNGFLLLLSYVSVNVFVWFSNNNHDEKITHTYKQHPFCNASFFFTFFYIILFWTFFL